MLPLYPAAALLVGRTLGSILEDRGAASRWFRVPLLILSGFILLASIAFCGVGIYFDQPFVTCASFVIPGLCLSLWAFRRYFREDRIGSFKAAATALGVLYLTAGLGIYPLLNTVRSYVPLFQYCDQLHTEGAAVSLFHPRESLTGAAVFYLKRNITDLRGEKELRAFLGSGEMATVLSDERRLPKLGNLHVLQSFLIGRRTHVLVRNLKPRQNTLGSEADETAE